MIILLSTILIFSIIIGANDKGLRVLPISILMGLILIYLIFLKIKNKDKNTIFKSNVDFFVLVFMITTTLPLIFGSGASYSNTIEFIMKYFFIYSVYILARNVLKDKRYVELTITVTIASSLIPAILGLDILYGYFLKRLYKMAKLRL